MADFIISAGTVSVTYGATTVTGTGTNFEVAGIEQGDEILIDGLAGYIDSVTDDGELELTVGWPGPTAAGKSYQIFKQRQAALAAENNYRLREILRKLESGAYTDADASGTLADRDAYDDEAKGFTFDDIETGEASNLIHRYVKASAANADWNGPFYFGRGEKGDPGGAGLDGEIQSSNDTLNNAIEMTQAAYDALGLPVEKTLYIIVD